MDNMREDCAEMDISLIQASRLAWDRAQWRSTIRKKGCQCVKTTSTAEDTSSLSGFLQILQEKQKTDYFYKYRTGLNNFGI